MVRRDDAKTQALAASRTLNPRPERVTDPADLVQVKYEMVRRAEVADMPTGQAAAAFGFSRQSLYSARTALRERGLGRSGPGQAWPQGRSQAHRPGRGPTRGTPGGRPRPAVGGAGRRGLAAFRRQRPSAFRSGGRCSAAAPPGARTSRPPGRRRKASDQPGSGNASIAGDDRAEFTWRYEVLRSAAAAGSGGWRHGLSVLVTRGWPPGWPRGPLCPPPRTGILEEVRDRVCQCCGVDGRDEQPGAPVLDDPGEPRHAQRYQRALRERLHRGVAERR
jgi:hypothetical protein